MPSTNGHKKTAVLYSRVSTSEQAEKGYSLAQQLQALREYAAHEGYEVLEEVTDPGQSGASLVRPGLDRARDLVAEGGVSVVLAQDADRITRDPAHRAFLDEEFERLGTRLVALDDWGDDTHEGELLKYLKGWVSKGERLKTTERTRRGKLQKVRQGKIIATMKPRYGFRYNEARNGLVVYEPEMAVVERIFRLAAEGFGTRAIQSRLYREGIPSPKGGDIWSRPIIKRMVLNDIYKPHTYEETAQLVSAEVAATLDPTQEYGIWWWNRSAKKTRQVSEPDGNGQRQYRKRVVTTPRDKQEWLAVPAPAYLPRALVEQARALIAAHRPPPEEASSPHVGATRPTALLLRLEDEHSHHQAQEQGRSLLLLHLRVSQLAQERGDVYTEDPQRP
jgi:DNA invertase Pin-like site-specific DNA recombinase